MQIRSAARETLLRCWRRRHQLWPRSSLSVEDFLVYAPESIASKLLGFQVSMPPRIDCIDPGSSLPNRNVVGLLDVANRTMLIAQEFGLETARFTLGHEIGHHVLNHGLSLHRELPILQGRPRSPKEREADLFSAELLMPSKLVRKEFLLRFKGIVQGRRNTDQMCYWFSEGGLEVNENLLVNNREYRAIQFAKASVYFGAERSPLHRKFHVSPKVMAIQLMDLGLVK